MIRNFVLKDTRLHRAQLFRIGAALILPVLISVVPSLTTPATAQTFSVVYNFEYTHGNDPGVGDVLVQGRDGNLYGTTQKGGADNNGVVFKITPSGKLKVLYSFDVLHGSQPYSGLTLGTDGIFYGTTYQGGIYHHGTIFKITRNGKLTTLYNFRYPGGRGLPGKDGGYPMAPPVQGVSRDFYGTTEHPNSIYGTVYKITSSGTFTSLDLFPQPPLAALLLGKDRNFYGTTSPIGGYGNIFKMTSTGGVTVLYSFDGTHGRAPGYGALIQGSDGDFYGTTMQGGSHDAGVVFKLRPGGALTVLHAFLDPTYPHDGYLPWGGLVQASDGNLYGVTYYGGTGGSSGLGVLFQITPAGNYSIIYNFTEVRPISKLMQHTNGKFYGLTPLGGPHGVVYSLDLGLGPFVRTVRTSEKTGKTVGILGGGLAGTTGVSFNGTSAAFTVVSDTYLTAVVPEGATTGFVTVTTPGGTLQSNQKFWIRP